MILAQEESRCCEKCGTPLALTASTVGCFCCLLTGRLETVDERQFQHYTIELDPEGKTLRELGRGAMGITYRAIDQNLGSAVALKIIRSRYSQQAAGRERFRREAQAAAKLRHPNVASVFHYGETPEGQSFYAMELVEGETLEARVRRERSLGSEIVLEIGLQVTRALIAAEKYGLVHRDLKPSNLMLMPNEQSTGGLPLVKVIDFGLAKILGTENNSEQLEQSGFSGTPGFASPEQSRPDLGTLDIRSDIYSLGATLRYGLTGRPLPPEREHSSWEDLRQRKVPQPLIALLRSMLAFEAAKRPQSATALAMAMEGCRHRLSLVRQRRRWLLAAVVMMASLLVGVFSFTKYLGNRAPVIPPAGIAVLPFANLDGKKEITAFADGLQNDILDRLAHISDLRGDGRDTQGYHAYDTYSK